MNTLINKKNSFYIDHIALGVNDTQEGIAYIEKLTGVTAKLPDSQHDNWYLSAALNLGNGTFLEIIGPNPNYSGFHPFKQILKELTEPQLVFWYLGTNNFKNTQSVIHANGFKLERYSHISKEIKGEKLDYEIAIIGKGFYSEQPCLIQWNEVPKQHYQQKEVCSIASFHIRCQQAKKLNTLFASLGMSFCVEQGNNQLSLTLNTPKGLVELHGGGIQFQGISSLASLLRLFKNHLKSKYLS